MKIVYYSVLLVTIMAGQSLNAMQALTLKQQHVDEIQKVALKKAQEEREDALRKQQEREAAAKAQEESIKQEKNASFNQEVQQVKSLLNAIASSSKPSDEALLKAKSDIETIDKSAKIIWGETYNTQPLYKQWVEDTQLLRNKIQKYEAQLQEQKQRKREVVRENNLNDAQTKAAAEIESLLQEKLPNLDTDISQVKPSGRNALFNRVAAILNEKITKAVVAETPYIEMTGLRLAVDAKIVDLAEKILKTKDEKKVFEDGGLVDNWLKLKNAIVNPQNKTFIKKTLDAMPQVEAFNLLPSPTEQEVMNMRDLFNEVTNLVKPENKPLYLEWLKKTEAVRKKINL